MRFSRKELDNKVGSRKIIQVEIMSKFNTPLDVLRGTLVPS